MDYEQKYKEALSWMQSLYNGLHGKTKEEAKRYFPELAESEDEKMRKELLGFIKNWKNPNNLNRPQDYPMFTKNEEQCDKYIAWLEKQGEPAKLSEEEQNRFAKGVLTSCALSFMGYLDTHRYKDKMCLSNKECEDIENAFYNSMWDKLHRYYCKYIEKQGEKDPCIGCTNDKGCVTCENGNLKEIKIEPKFKVGDWITNGESTWKVTDIKPLDYILQSQNGDVIDDTISYVDEYFHFWTIQDAKDGDVLVFDDIIMIFKNIKTACTANTYILYCNGDGIVVDDWCDFGPDAHPATKEQRDLLFQKMKEEGYEWDAEKKEFKKIEQKHTLSKYDKGFNDGYSAAKYNQWRPSESQLKVLQTAIKDYGFCVEKHVLESLYNDLKKL